MSSIAISIVVPYFNASDCVDRLFISLADYATRDDIEIIIVDDCSTVEQAMVLDAKADTMGWPQLNIIHCERNGGAAKARKIGIEAATGEYIAFLDSDDAWALNKLDPQLAAMRQFDAAISGCPCEQIDEADLTQQRATAVSEYDAVVYSRKKAMFYNAYSTPTVMLKRDIALQHPFSDTMRFSEDVDCWRRILLNHKGIILHRPNAFMFKHAFLSDEGSLSSYTFKMSAAQLSSLARLITNPSIALSFKLLVPVAMVWASVKAARREFIVWRHRRKGRA